jgi:hypothetical protein
MYSLPLFLVKKIPKNHDLDLRSDDIFLELIFRSNFAGKVSLKATPWTRIDADYVKDFIKFCI